MKCYWLLADGKTVREIPYAKLKQLNRANWKNAKRRYKLVLGHDGYVGAYTFFDGGRAFFLSKPQLRKLLGEEATP